MQTPHGSKLLTIQTEATVKDMSTAILDAVTHIMRTGEGQATLCVPEWLQAGSPWTLQRSTEYDGWLAERGPSDHPDPEQAQAAACRITFSGCFETAGERILGHDRANPYVVDWDKREAHALAA